MTSRGTPKITASDLTSLPKEDLIALVEQALGGTVSVTFSGKADAARVARKVRPRVMRQVKKLSAGTPEAQAANSLIEGDNLQAMSTLFRERGNVDLILTDPPYNTGNDFRYNDKWETDPNDPGIGDLVAGDDGARHTKWMRFMYPRLQMMRSMLKPGGILAICIDFRELFHLGQMMDELFGEQNRLAIINWQRSYSPTNDAEHVATTTEYVLVYARQSAKAVTRLLPRAVGSAAVSNPDADPLPWTDAPATGSNAKAHKSMVYGIQSPFTGKVLYPPAGSAWRQGQQRNLEQIQEWGSRYRLVDLHDEQKRAELIGVAVDELPKVKAIVLADPLSAAKKRAETLLANGVWARFYFLARGKGRPRLKKYVSEIQDGLVPATYWAADQIDPSGDLPEAIGPVSWSHNVSGHSQQGVRELTEIVGPGHEFKTVKPKKLFAKIMTIWCPRDGLILDPFAGSGTTGEVTLDLNAGDGGSRRFILIEQGRPENGDPYASSLTANRLRRVVTGDWKTGAHEPLGGGFTFQRLDRRVDSDALLQMERDEMVDTVIASHFDANRKRGSNLIRLNAQKPFRYLVAKNTDDEGFFLVWDGPKKNTDITMTVYEACVAEAEAERLKPVYHVYARLCVYQTKDLLFYQIPDRILSDFGLGGNEPYNEADI